MRQSDILETLADLVRINSINPAYDNGNSEAEIASYIADFFAARGVETWLQEALPGRPNLIARLPGRQPGRRIVLEAHTDTVSVTGMTIPPFEPEIRDGRLYGRGSCDTKAGLAGMMHALASLRQEGVTPPCEVWLAAAADEEFSFRGVVKLCEGLTADAAVVAEPTELRAVIASKGVLRWVIRTTGKAAHSSKPHLGVNAIAHMARIVDVIERHNCDMARRSHPLLGPPTVNVGVIRGGVQVNFVPDQCEIEIDRRLLPGEKVEQVLDEYRSMLEKLGAADSNFRAEMDAPMLADEALETAPDSAVARIACSILADMDLDPQPCGVPYGSDASKLSRQGVPAIIFGPGSIDRAHGAVEYIECDQVAFAAEFYREMLLRFE